jgi:hypothetical protein
MRKLLLLLFIIGVCSINSYAQKKSSANASGNNKNWNLPPDAIVHPKANTSIDYSFKLNEFILNESEKAAQNDFGKDMTEENFESMRKDHPEAFKYYKEAEGFYKSLSNKVKAAYTGEELWYIYMFDQNLKNRLPSIR